MVPTSSGAINDIAGLGGSAGASGYKRERAVTEGLPFGGRAIAYE